MEAVMYQIGNARFDSADKVCFHVAELYGVSAAAAKKAERTTKRLIKVMRPGETTDQAVQRDPKIRAVSEAAFDANQAYERAKTQADFAQRDAMMYPDILAAAS
jgi:hypothetical protein